MKKVMLILFAVLIHFSGQAQKRILVFTKTAGYHHASIPEGIAAVRKLGKADGYAVDTTTSALMFNEYNLKRYAAIVFLNTSGNVLDTAQKSAFQRYIQAGGGFMGIHCASSTEKTWRWYGQLVGAVFTDHPEPQEGFIDVTDAEDPSTKHLPGRFRWKDEWYNFRDIGKDIHILLKADERTYTGGTNGPGHPLAWKHEFDGGRAFYTALGHFPAAYSDPLLVKHIQAGILFAIGNNVKLDYSKVKTQLLTEKEIK